MASALLDCERMKYPHTGLYHFCLNLGLNLLQQKAPSDQVTVFLPEAGSNPFGEKIPHIRKKRINTVRIPFSSGYNLPPSDAGFDVWHMTHQTSRYRPVKARMVLTIHDLNFLYDDPSTRKQDKYLRLIQDRIDRADHIVCISNYCREDVQKKLNVKNKTVSVIYNGGSLISHSVLAAPTYKPDRPFLFALGTILPKKNFHVLPPLLKKFDGELIIAGSGGNDYEKFILSEARKFSVADRVKIIGPISEQEKYWYYSHCEAFLFPSIAEGFGLPVVEAMSLGKPVFLSTHTSLPEIGGPHAYYFRNFDPASMQEELVRGLDNFSAMKKEAKIKNWAHQFSWEHAATAYWDIYHSLSARIR